MVVFKCQQFNALSGKCMEEHYNETRFLEYAKSKGFIPAQRPSFFEKMKNDIFGSSV